MKSLKERLSIYRVGAHAQRTREKYTVCP